METVSKKTLMLFAGQGNEELSREIAECLGIPLGDVRLSTFASGELQSQTIGASGIEVSALSLGSVGSTGNVGSVSDVAAESARVHCRVEFDRHGRARIQCADGDRQVEEMSSGNTARDSAYRLALGRQAALAFR